MNEDRPAMSAAELLSTEESHFSTTYRFYVDIDTKGYSAPKPINDT